MDNNSKYDDVAYLLTDLCCICTDDELKILTALSARMKQDASFFKTYLKQLKLKYIQAIPKIQKGTYKKIPFAKLHKMLLLQINKNIATKRYPLLSDKTRV